MYSNKTKYIYRYSTKEETKNNKKNKNHEYNGIFAVVRCPSSNYYCYYVGIEFKWPIR